MRARILLYTALLLMASSVMPSGAKAPAEAESLPPLQDGKAPETFAELWDMDDPRREPLDVEILHQWEEGGAVLKLVRFRVGIFKGQKAMMLAVYGYPKGGKDLPGLVQAHGGGQAAHYKACLTNAKRGYATISLAWTGRLHAPGYTVSGGGVKLFWAGKTEDPDYKVTKDWGALDGYDAPARHGRDFGGVKPDEHTIDPVESPRNSGWFLCALGARRALTFLEQQPEVDGERLGIYGHSMGGQISGYAAGSDSRVKAAAPSCGGISYRGSKNLSQEIGWGNASYLKNTTCPIIFLSPANDFHGRISSLPLVVNEIKSKDWRVTCAPHHNHQDTAPYTVAAQLWFDQHLKGTFQWPATPITKVTLNTATGVPSVTVRPDTSKSILSLRVFYAQQGAMADKWKEHLNNIHRFWRSAKVVKQGDVWTAELPVFSTERPLWVYANAHYPLDEPVSGVGYYYGDYTAEQFNVSSVVEMVEPKELQAAGVKPTIQRTALIEDFQGNWEHEWYNLNGKRTVWERKTNKLYDSMYQAPDFAKLAFGMSSRQAGTLTISLDGHSARFDLDGSGTWQDVALLPLDLTNKAGDGRLDWKNLHGMSLVFKPAKAEDAIAPLLRNLRWAEGTRDELNARRKVRLDEAPLVDGKTYLDITHADRVRHDLATNMNTSFGGSPLAIGDKTYERGIGTHANSEILFFLAGKYACFHAEVGAQKPLPASIRFTVLADGKPVFDSGVMTRGQGPKVIDLDVSGVLELDLVVDDGGNGKHADHANWANAYLTKQGAAPQSSRLISPKDYSYAYWKNGWRKSKDDRSANILCFESGHYGFMLDIAKPAAPRFGRFADDSTVLSCLEAGTGRMDTLPEADLDLSVELKGKRYRLVSCLAGESGNLSFVRMLEAGQVAQHFDIQHLVFEDANGKKLGCYGDLAMVAWPNSLTFTLKLMPDFLYQDGPSEGITGSGHCIIGTPLDIPHQDEIDPEVLTVECWMKTPKSIEATGNTYVLCKNAHGWQDGNIAFRYWGRNITAEMNFGGGRENKHSLDFGHIKRNEWNHLALTYDGKEMKAYLNGNLAATKTIGKRRTPGKGFLRIGKRADGNSAVLKGLYDELRIWSRPLSHAEIRAHVQQPGALASREGLVLNRNFDGRAVEKPAWQDATVRLSFKGDGKNWQTERRVQDAWDILKQKSFSLNCNLESAKTEPVAIKVTTPDKQSFPVTFDQQMNCYMSTVKGLKRPKDFGADGGRNYDDFTVEISNAGTERATVPFLLNFRDGFGITGTVPLLYDANGKPTGIPVQLSKNWHYGAYKLPYVMLPAAPGTTRYLLRTVYGFYGTLPSASHAQLSLIGYGGNGRWDQLAIGGWGETICFDIGMSLTDRAVTDIRGLMFRNGADGKKWGWTDAGHGADWLGVRDSNNKLLFNDLKTAYLAHGPCLTDVRYAGYYGADRQVELQAQVQTLRTDDYARTFQNLAYSFVKPVSTEKSFLYHLSSKAITPKVVYGNKAGVIAELDVPATAKTVELLADHLRLSGEGPWWIAFPNATLGHENQGVATGTRALIIRSYQATYSGTTETAPTISLPVEDKGNSQKGVACDLVAPKGISTFKPGDCVRFEMALITLPRIADDYYGDNQAFIQHLRKNPRSWKTVYREAIGNDLEVTVSGGRLLKCYPVMIQATSKTITAEITGGVGFAPIRFENLDSPDYVLYELYRGKEVLLDQSIHGNDYWQTDYDAASNSYKMTFNLPLDGKPTSSWILKKQAKLTIDEARYGVKGKPAQQVDLKATLQQMADNDINMIVVDNRLAGKDPAPRIRKSLELEFTRNGKRISKSIPEGHKIDFGTGAKASQMTYRDVAYDVHERTKLNFWQAKGQGPRPLVVLIHGGGWLGRDKSEIEDVTRFLAKGISVAAINYRYSSIAPLPAPAHDAARAVQFLRYKAADWNIDKNKIVLSGDSAGGCSSVLIACLPDFAKPDSGDPVERESSRIQGAAGAGAQVSVDPMQIKAWVGEAFAVHGMIHQAVGEASSEATWKNYAQHEATFKAFSAINHLSQDDPPIYLAYDANLTVPAISYGHAIHHGMFGVKFQERSKAVSHNNVHLSIRKAYTCQYGSPTDFIIKTLLRQ